MFNMMKSALESIAMNLAQPQLITSNPNILLGKPVVAGTRITVKLILEKLAAGETIDQILESHSRLTPESIYAAIAFAAQALRADVIYSAIV
jgi:uncharacterized protein (DUF433 family)